MNTIRLAEIAGDKFRKASTSDSRATTYRRQAKANERLKISFQRRSITEFFQPGAVQTRVQLFIPKQKEPIVPIGNARKIIWGVCQKMVSKRSEMY